jgi:hypothetical protein
MSRFEAMDDSPKYRVQDFMLRQNTEGSEMYWYVGVLGDTPSARFKARIEREIKKFSNKKVLIVREEMIRIL